LRDPDRERLGLDDALRPLVNEQPVEGALALLDGDVLTIGQARFAVRIERPGSPTMPPDRQIIERPSNTTLARFADGPTELALGPREAMLALLRVAAESGRESSNFEVLDVLRQFQSDTATLLEAQIERIEKLHHEIATLRDEMHGPRGPIQPPAPPLRLDLSPPPAPSGESAGWLLDRLNTLETESRSTWKDLVGRIASTVVPRPASTSTGQTLASTRPESPTDDPS
jgi:hypothetical protein